uniref:TSC22 domain family member 4 n=1 Tax=Sphenodon punctatus TaxID=8508 RepID=A0A8D0G573_SPHPU
MSGGRKKSGFQITSVTSDYEQQEMPPAPGGENKSLASPKAQRGPAHADGAEPAEKHSQSVNGGAGPKNGPSAPSSPGAPPFQGPVGAAGSSRFRVVKLDQGLGEPSKRGRWTCLDFYDRDPDHHAAGRLLDSARHPHSLDSRLEVSGFVPKPLSPFSPQPQRRAGYLHSQLVLPTPGPSGHQARSLGGGIAVLLRPDRAPAGPASLRNPLEPAEVGVPAPGNGTEESAQPTPSRVPLVVLEDQPLPKSVAQLIQREAERKALPRDSRSRPSSPASPFLRDGSPHRRPSDPFGMSHAARLSLARSMFTMGGAQDSDDDRPGFGSCPFPRPVAEGPNGRSGSTPYQVGHEPPTSICPWGKMWDWEIRVGISS